MKLEDFPKIQKLALELSDVNRRIKVVDSRKGFGVTIDGVYQSDEYLDAAAIGISLMLTQQKGRILTDLAELGVEV